MADVCISHTKPLSWQEEDSDCAPLSSTPTTEANDDVSTASESELDSVQDSDVDDSEDEDRYSKKRNRRLPPPIFFGTPKQAEHEKREIYATQARNRRLLRKDSLELTRRKSGGMDRGNRREAPSPALKALRAEDNDISALVLSDDFLGCNLDEAAKSDEEARLEAGSEGDHHDDSNTEEESLSEDGSTDDESILTGDRTIRLPKGASEALVEDPPSTPTKQILRPYIPRPSLAVSEADSSPGIALAQHPSSASRPSPFFRLSPASSSKLNQHRSPLVSIVSPLNQPPAFAADELMFDEKEQNYSHSVSPRKSVLKESPSKINQTVSPSKSAQSSPTKVVVRQTLSAWAHAKLKTPQSPEKREWDQKNAQVASPSRTSYASSSVSADRDNLANSLISNAAHREQHLPASASRAEPLGRAEKPSANEKTVESTIREQLNRPSGKIARPLAPSRLPRPVQKAPAVSTLNGTAPKRIVVLGAAPTFRRIVDASNSSSRRANAATTSYMPAPSRSAPRPTPFAQPSGPFRPQSANARSVEKTSAPRSFSSSPTKMSSLQRTTSQTSSPVRKAPSSSTTIVRDARLIAAPRRAPEVPLERPSSALSSSSSHSVAPSPLSSVAQSSVTCTPVQMSGGVGGARRVAISQEAAAPIVTEPRVNGMQRVERLQSDESRGIRIKEIMMGKTSALDKTLSSDGNDVPSSSISIASEDAVTPVLQKSDVQHIETKLGDKPRSSRRKVEKESSAKSTKPVKSPSVFSSSSTGQKDAGKVPLSKTELSRLTSLHTHRNELFISRLETIVVRKSGENRPCSPSSKIRKSIVGDGSALKSEAAKEARKQRARKRTPEAFEEEVDSSSFFDQKHVLGAGEDSVFLSPPRSSNRHVRWHRTLICGPNDASTTVKAKSASIVRGCLRNKYAKLDHLGNVLEANQPWSPRLTRNKVTIYKLIYDDDEQ